MDVATDRLNFLAFSNHPPLESEYNAIITLMNDTKQQIIDKSDPLHLSISQKRYTLLHGILSPLRRTPPEILGRIFMMNTFSFTLQTDSGEFECQSTLDPRQSAWNVSRVCSYWRSVSINYGPLWSSVILDFRSPYSSRLAASAMLETQIRRSGTCELSIVVNSGHWWQQDAVFRALTLLAPHFSRCASLHLRVELRTIETLLYTTSTRVSFPVLRTIHLDTMRDYPSSRGNSPLLGLFEKSPLRDASMNSELARRLRLPWFGIRSYIGTLPSSASSHHQLLQHAENVVNLTLCVARDRDRDESQPLPLVILPGARRLSIVSEYDKEEDPVFRSLVLPALERLDVCLSAVEPRAILNFIVRSNCGDNLRVLQMRVKDSGDSAAASSASLVEVLALVPKLESLCLRIVSPTARSVALLHRALCPSTNTATLVPYLRRLDVASMPGGGGGGGGAGDGLHLDVDLLCAGRQYLREIIIEHVPRRN